MHSSPRVIVVIVTLFGALQGLAAAAGAIVVKDDTGAEVRLAAPARRIVALAPNVVENLFAIGAGEALVGVVDFSDYPAAANRLPRIGGAALFDLESLIARKPDLVIGWLTGGAQLEQVRALGFPLYVSQPNRFEDVASELRRFGRLTGRDSMAEVEADRFLERLARLRAASAGKRKVRVFYQIWHRPLVTVGGAQIISSAIAACGGENIFADEKLMAPHVGEEAVVAANPEVIVAGGSADVGEEGLQLWRRWPQLVAVKRGNLFFVPPDLMQRHTPRLLDGAEMLCRHLDVARSRGTE